MVELGGLRRVVTGGAPVGTDDAEALAHVAPSTELQIMYGSTEVDPIAHLNAAHMPEDDGAEGVCVGPLCRELQARRAHYAEFRGAAPLPDHFVTYGNVCAGNDFGAEQAVSEQAGALLTGLGAHPGIVERPAVVLFEPDTSVKLDGEILVTRQTDPGWVVLFPAISGLVVERGSMLSHSAIVAREMGIAAVVGVQGAASRITPGDKLRLDGAKGTVEILEEAE